MSVYYNEVDAYTAHWLRNLISAGLIAPGDVDERDIRDVRPSELRPYTQCHFFAGIGVWSYALRLAGWDDDRPVWTGSCPCQPFSAAGKGAGFADERHLWPYWHHLIKECRPAKVFGEQVASADGLDWLDLVQADLEGTGYAVGAVDLCAAGVGAPNIRQRLWFVADANKLAGRQGRAIDRGRHTRSDAQARSGFGSDGMSGVLGNAGNARLAQRFWQSRISGGARRNDEGQAAERAGFYAGDVAHSHDNGRPQGSFAAAPARHRSAVRAASSDDRHDAAGPVNGFWRDAEWLLCRDGKWRPVEPGTFPLVDGSAGRVGRVRTDQERLAAISPRKDQGSRTGRLRAYGNAINAEAAATFIRAAMIDAQAKQEALL